METLVARIMFTVGIFLIILALIPLPLLQPNSVEFWVDIAGLAMATFVVVAVARSVRRSRPPSAPPTGEGSPPDASRGGEDT